MQITITQLFKCNAYIGENRRNWNSNMNLFILGHKYDIYFMNLKYTLFLFKKIINVLSLNSKRRILMLIPRDVSIILRFKRYQRNKLSNGCSNFRILRKWVFGIMSNYDVLKYKWKLKFPKFIFLFSNLTEGSKYVTILNEIRKYNIVSMGFISTSDNPYLLDYFIPINNNSIELTKLYFRFILIYFYTLNFKYKLKFFKKIIKKKAIIALKKKRDLIIEKNKLINQLKLEIKKNKKNKKKWIKG